MGTYLFNKPMRLLVTFIAVLLVGVTLLSSVWAAPPEQGKGPPGVRGYEIRTVNVSVPSPSASQFDASCPSSKKVLGGGVRTNNSSVALFESFPKNDTTWRVGFKTGATGSSPSPVDVTIYAICANASP